MGDFFYGWRRKAGVVTAAIACLLTVAWVRSLTTIDTVEYWSSFTVQDLRSFKGTFHWSGREHGRVIPRAIRGRFDWQYCPISRENDSQFGGPSLSRWYWDRLGVSYWRQNEPIQVFEFNVRYSSVVIPLTVLSAYLLLFKPRQRKSASATIQHPPSNEL